MRTQSPKAFDASPIPADPVLVSFDRAPVGRMTVRAIARSIGWTSGGMCLLALSGLLPLAGCGGSASVDPAANGDSRAPQAGGAAGTLGVGPIDAIGLPKELPMNCAVPIAPPRLALPCQVGLSLTHSEGPASLNVLECYDLVGGTALTSFIPFGKIPALLNQPVQIPFAAEPAPPSDWVTIDGAHYTGELHGTVVFSQVDPMGRAFVGRLTGGQVMWTGLSNMAFSCTIPNTTFWAVPGDFL